MSKTTFTVEKYTYPDGEVEYAVLKDNFFDSYHLTEKRAIDRVEKIKSDLAKKTEVIYTEIVEV